MLHRTACIRRAVRQFEKEVSFRLGTREEHVNIELYGTRRPPVRKRS